MKSIYHFYISSKRLLAGGILGLLSFTIACSIDDGESVASNSTGYESLGATFSVKGKVTTQNDQILENILIEVPYDINASEPYENTEKLYTDKNGEFLWTRKDTPKERVFRFIAKDIDGTKNGGEFKNDTTDVKFTLKELSDSGGNGIWSQGSAKHTLHIRLTKKNN